MDLCVAAHGTAAFQGPLLGQVAADAGQASSGLAYAQVSAYLSLAPGAYDVRIVPAGAADCSTPTSLDAGSVPDVTNLPAFAPYTNATLLVAGELTPSGGDMGLTVAAIGDDVVLERGGAALRAVNAMPGIPSLDFDLGSSDAGWVPLFTGVAFASAASRAGTSVGAVDPNGYLSVAPPPGPTASAGSLIERGTRETSVVAWRESPSPRRGHRDADRHGRSAG